MLVATKHLYIKVGKSDETNYSITTVEPLKTALGVSGPHFIWLLFGCKKMVCNVSQTSGHHSLAYAGALLYTHKLKAVSCLVERLAS